MTRRYCGLAILLMALMITACGGNTEDSHKESTIKKANKGENEITTSIENPSDLTWLVREADEEDTMEVVIFDKDITPENYMVGKVIKSITIYAEGENRKVELLIETDFPNGNECANVQYTMTYEDGFTDTMNTYIQKLHFVEGGVSFSLYAPEWIEEIFVQNADMEKMTCTVVFVDDCFESVNLKVVSKNTLVEYLEDMEALVPIGDAQDYGIGLLSFPLDEEYFTPKSDDYMYVITYNYVENRPDTYNYGKLVSQDASLISFDADGNCIQYVMREYDLGFDMTPDSYKDEFNWIYDDGALPYCRRYSTFNYKLQAILDAGDDPYYLSKPLTSNQTNGKAICSKEDVFLPEYETLLNELGVGEDYYISQSHYHEDEYISKQLIRYENYEPIEQQVRNYADIDYEKIDLYVFDEDGFTTHNISIYVFADEAGIDNWLKKMYGAYYDGGYVGDYAVDASLPKDFKFEDTSYTGRKGNLLYKIKEVTKSEAEGKWSFEIWKSEKENDYFSKQFLTDKQLKNALEK